MLTNQEIDPTQQTTPERWNPVLRPFVRLWFWLFPPSVAAKDRQSNFARYMAMALIVSLSVSLLIFGILYAKPIQDSWQSSQAETMVREARDLMQNGQYVNAVYKAQEAYTKAPHNAEAVRINAEFLTLLGKEHAIFFQDKLKEMGVETLEDKMLRVKILKKLHRDKEAVAELEKLLRTEPNSVPLAKLAEEILGKGPRHGALLGIMKDLAAKNANDDESVLRLAKVQLESGLPSEVSAAVDAAWKIAQKDDPMGLRALEFLNSVPSLPTAMQRDFIHRMKTHPRSKEPHYVAALRREAALFPERKKNIIDAGAEWFKDKKRDQLYPFIRWLVEEKQFLQVLTMLPESEAKTHQGLLENYLNALTVVAMDDPRRFAQIEAIIEDPEVAKILDATTHAMFRAHLAFVENKPAEELRARLITAKGLAEQSSRYDSLQSIARYAEARGQFDIAEEAFRLTIRAARAAANANSGRIELDSYTGLINASRKNGNSQSYLAACRDAAQRFPENSFFLDQQLYASILAGEDIELSLNKSIKLLQNQPKDDHRRLMVSLAHYRLQNQQTAVSYLQLMDLNNLTEGQRAVFAAIAAAGGYKQQAMEVVRDISPKAVMFPEERVCYQRAVN